jgi:DNA-binding transcriptional LysR family regulator
LSINHTDQLGTSRKKLDLNLLPIFIEIFVHSSVTLASSVLGTSPSSVSQSLNKLREYFDDVLFVRQGQQLSPSPLARKIYELLQDDCDLLVNKVQSVVAPDINQTITMHCSPYLSVRLIPYLSNFIWAHNSECRITHKALYLETHSQEDLLRFRLTDLIFDFEPNLSRSMCNVPIMYEELCFVAATNHPRLDQTLNATNCKNETFVLFETTDNKFTPSKLEVQNLVGERNVYLRSNSFFTLLSVIEKSTHIGVMPVWMFNKFKSSFNIQMMNTSEILSPQPVYLIYNKNFRDNLRLHDIINYIKSFALQNTLP